MGRKRIKILFAPGLFDQEGVRSEEGILRGTVGKIKIKGKRYQKDIQMNRQTDSKVRTKRIKILYAPGLFDQEAVG